MVTLKYILDKFKVAENPNVKSYPLHVSIKGKIEPVTNVEFIDGKWILDIQ